MSTKLKIIFLFTLLLVQGCIVSTPKVENAAYMTAIFNHANFLNSCVACHESKRPAPVAAVAHGGGADCAQCHQPPTWLYGHNPTPTSCNTCHDSTGTHPQRPTDTVHISAIQTPGSLVPVRVAPHYGSQDCVLCHVPATGTAPAAWAFKHTPQPTSCNSCHADRKPATIPGTTTAHVATTADCVNCHTTRTWAGFSHNPTPTSCNSCHDTGGRAPYRPATNSSHNSKVRNHYVGVDCVSCHTPPPSPYGNQWKNGASLNCMPCHQSKGQREHGTSVRNCSGCHSPLRSSW